MQALKQLVVHLLRDAANKIDAGTCELSDEEATQMLKVLSHIIKPINLILILIKLLTCYPIESYLIKLLEYMISAMILKEILINYMIYYFYIIV